jgi:hypothetical protein
VIRLRTLLAAGLIAASCLVSPRVIPGLRGAESLPDKLTDQEFWDISRGFSEQDGYFRSDNLLSNERGFPHVLRELQDIPSGVYMGVGPEQNFNYIAALRPKMAFIVDIRRGNLDLHLMYKALFALSADRAGFVSKLFSRPQPPGLTPTATPTEIFGAYANVEKNEALYTANLKAITDELVQTHHFALSSVDLSAIEYVYGSFYTFGPEIRYSSSQGGGGFGGFNQPTYAELMTAADEDGRFGSYLATEQRFQALKALEANNLVVPVIGNFGGPKAIRAVGQYLRDHAAVVSAFYLSNVEMYLMQQSLWESFCRNVASLPLDARSTFIRSNRSGRTVGLDLTLASIAGDVKNCF